MPWSAWTTKSPFLELRQGGEQRLGPRLGDAPAPFDPLAEDLLLGDDRQLLVGQPEAGREAPQHQDRSRRGRCAGRPRDRRRGEDRRARAGREDARPGPGYGRRAESPALGCQSCSRAASAAIPCPPWSRPPRISPLPSALRRKSWRSSSRWKTLQGREIEPAPAGEMLLIRRRGEKELSAGAKGSPSARACSSPSRTSAAKSGPPPAPPPADRGPPRPAGGVVEKGVELPVVEGEEEGSAGGEKPLAELFQDRLPLGAGNLQSVAALLEAAGEGLQMVACQHHLPGGQQDELLQLFFCGALGGGIEGTHPFDESPKNSTRTGVVRVGGKSRECPRGPKRCRGPPPGARRGSPGRAGARAGRWRGYSSSTVQPFAERGQDRPGDHPLQQRPHRQRPRARARPSCRAARAARRAASTSGWGFSAS